MLTVVWLRGDVLIVVVNMIVNDCLGLRQIPRRLVDNGCRRVPAVISVTVRCRRVVREGRRPDVGEVGGRGLSKVGLVVRVGRLMWVGRLMVRLLIQWTIRRRRKRWAPHSLAFPPTTSTTVADTK